MKLIDGIFKYGETVAIDVDGKLVKRKVRYADGKLFVEVDGKTITKNELNKHAKFDKYAYDKKYIREHLDKMAVAAPKGTKEKWKATAMSHKMSLNKFIIYCVEKEIDGE